MSSCSRCALITSVQKMLKSDKIKLTQDEIRKEVSKFIGGEISFRMLGSSLGLSEEEMIKYVDKEIMDGYINGK